MTSFMSVAMVLQMLVTVDAIAFRRSTPVISLSSSDSIVKLDTAAEATYLPVMQAFGADILSHFTTFTGADPTHGFINYTNMDFAQSQGYVGSRLNPELNQTVAYIGMDHSTVESTGRNSVRLSSKANFTVGSLFVMDVAHVPAAFGQWSSFWLLGQDGAWPYSGEIDIFESVHQSTSNTLTLHTGPGCSIANDSTAALGTVIQTNCNAGNGNTGCGTVAPSTIIDYDGKVNTAGKPFNDQGGAIFVTEWTSTGIDIWVFSRDAVPISLDSNKPDTKVFPKPVAHFAGPGCSFDKAFRDMQLIINIDACGDWAGQVWQFSGAATATGVADCATYVKNNPEAFEEAYFEFVSLTIYQSSS